MLEFVITEDGSKTIYNTEVGENYHSRHGALQESQHVFLNSGLIKFLDKREFTANENNIKVSPSGGDLQGTALTILEVGFGTGLNFLLSADHCSHKQINLEYTGIEAYPLDPGLISQTGYDQYLSASIWDRFISQYPDSLKNQVRINSFCQLQTAHCQLLNFSSNKQYDVIYFDAFASARQPEMWDEQAITHTVRFLKPGGIFVTYAITGNLKRMLKSLGLKVEKAPGAPGKREMLRAIKPLF
ncbi:tRNA (5-methylaminomethyl-2-thiouridine)(34)-methyltransferase MnmD [Mucilaginibacter sp.]|uniref:tRNA (5-methylaminomethyl-2-thiouridine)(34)-methyltransferase MnmD n=1 Tax=Mucilaginibacter sp. TaxID=1882438 RepID=UPI00260B3396|nr:tRNA (5-methylaminomethyl-2-thiouridine)(34)-methyltransferase MnmD [Mucilaginibacter sp.]MDB5031521.1 mnmC [Mucilaginibacter sp.]